MTTDDPMTELKGPDGVPIVDPGRRPATGPGGDHGRPALDARGRKRCCVCYQLLQPVDGGSVYCREHKKKAKQAAVTKRNSNRRQAEAHRKDLRQGPRFEGPGFTHGRTGLYLDKDTVAAITKAYGGVLAAHVEAAPLARAKFDPKDAYAYHQALRDILHAVTDINAVLRGPFFPEASRRATGHEGNQS
jgi:hypothetical protein